MLQDLVEIAAAAAAAAGAAAARAAAGAAAAGAERRGRQRRQQQQQALHAPKNGVLIRAYSVFHLPEKKVKKLTQIQ